MTAVFAFGDGACTDKMAELAGPAAEGLLCSQAGIPVQAAGKKFLDAYKAKFKVEPILYSPFTYDAANLLIAAMKKADSPDPAKYLPALAASDYTGASGNIQFDEKGDRKDAEMTIFTLKEGKITPIAILKSGKSMTLDEYAQATAPAAPAAPAPAAAPGAAAPAAGAAPVAAPAATAAPAAPAAAAPAAAAPAAAAPAAAAPAAAAPAAPAAPAAAPAPAAPAAPAAPKK
jgi:branched-chain amino acid transport system substrate-binding protein